jgi:cytochrome c553
MYKLLILFLIALGNVCSAQTPEVDAALIAQSGNVRGVPACTTCHGPNGAGSGPFPRLAGSGQRYLSRQLESFASGERKNAVMGPIAQKLTAQERVALGDYYSRLPKPSFQPPTGDVAPANVGAWIANRGRWSDDLPACAQCHGPGGEGVGPDFPPLHGLPAEYIVTQLKAWRSATRAPGPLGLMTVIAGKLSDADSQAIADYYAGALTTVQTPPPVKQQTNLR